MYNGKRTEGEKLGIGSGAVLTTNTTNRNKMYNRLIPIKFSLLRETLNRQQVPQYVNVFREKSKTVVLPIFRGRTPHQNTQIVIPDDE